MKTEKEIRRQLKRLKNGVYDNFYRRYSGVDAREEVIKFIEWVLDE
jgi:hypothetical protein